MAGGERGWFEAGGEMGADFGHELLEEFVELYTEDFLLFMLLN